MMIWRSEKAVVCGKHQNVCAEANFRFCKENQIDIARRLSGGGTVFHDLGNINFTFIKNLNEGIEKAINYKQFLEPVRQVLLDLGIPTTYSHRDDLLLNGLKISGNAQHIYQKGMRLLHHGTLLYNSDLKSLNQSIRSKGTYIGKSVPSNRSEVINISAFKNLGPVESFLDLFKAGFERFWGMQYGELTTEEVAQIRVLQKEKFETEKWIVGYSPKYIHTRMFETKTGSIAIEMHISDGVIQQFEMALNGEALVSADLNLVGQDLNLSNLRKVFPNLSDSELLEFF
jgi:lipoate-protein ligase A